MKIRKERETPLCQARELCGRRERKIVIFPLNKERLDNNCSLKDSSRARRNRYLQYLAHTYSRASPLWTSSGMGKGYNHYQSTVVCFWGSKGESVWRCTKWRGKAIATCCLGDRRSLTWTPSPPQSSPPFGKVVPQRVDDITYPGLV